MTRSGLSILIDYSIEYLIEYQIIIIIIIIIISRMHRETDNYLMNKLDGTGEQTLPDGRRAQHHCYRRDRRNSLELCAANFGTEPWAATVTWPGTVRCVEISTARISVRLF